MVLPNTDCFLVTADVVSLFPNVDAKKALIALDLFLREATVPETPLLIQLAGKFLIIISYLQNLVRIFLIKCLVSQFCSYGS